MLRAGDARNHSRQHERQHDDAVHRCQPRVASGDWDHLAHVSLAVMIDVTLRRFPPPLVISNPLRTTLWPLCSFWVHLDEPNQRQPKRAQRFGGRRLNFFGPRPARRARVGSVAFASAHDRSAPCSRQPTTSTIGRASGPCGGPANSAPAPRPRPGACGG